MGDKSGIQWTDATWNPVSGCDRVSAGCDHCYALTLAGRLKRMGQANYQTDGNPKTSGPGFGVALHEHMLDQPLRWKRPRRIFVNSMSDLFHDDVPDRFIERVFDVMRDAHWHTFQVLTKRPRRMASFVQRYCVPGAPSPNVWLGVSVEDQRWADQRIPLLLETPAAVRFLSIEPMLGPIELWDYFPATVNPADEYYHELVAEGKDPYEASGIVLMTMDEGSVDLPGVDWVIVGGESGPGHRTMALEWAGSLVDQCVEAGVPVFVKQLGAAWRQDGDSHGADPAYWPEALRLRQFPVAGTLL